VDVVVGYVSGATVAPEVLTRMAADGAVVTNFCFDDKVYWPGARLGGRYRSPAAIAHAVDLNLTSDPNGIIRYAAHGGIAMFHPEAADPGCIVRWSSNSNTTCHSSAPAMAGARTSSASSLDAESRSSASGGAAGQFHQQ